ncbi:MAG TPA: alpha/beta fold hydrolase [Dehalococcoidia bacterium]|nr:alpha/beta fold hydrolase [Dehalococcoidia bacterium]
MYFRDRKDAGEQLAAVLKQKGYVDAVVLGIPRGGLPVATEVARAVGGILAVVVARKLGAPGNPELAIGATTASGITYINEGVARAVGASQAYIDAEKLRQVLEAQRREELFDGHRRPGLKDRTVIVVDDGVATGATAIAAIRATKAEGAKRVVIAVPVGPPEMIELLGKEADEVVCLESDPGFWAVGQYYDNFDQVSDQDVRALLNAYAAPPPAPDSTHVTIKRNQINLAGILTTPAGAGPFPLVIFVHGLGSGKDSPRNVTIAAHIVDSGIATLLFDLSGHGESLPDPHDGLGAYVADLQAAFAWATVAPQVKNDAIGIAGSSLGATIAVKALIEGHVKPRTMVLRAPPVEPEDFRRIDVPSLVLIGSLDPLRSDVEWGATPCPQLTLSVVQGASHLFEEPGTLEQALRLTVGWFVQHLLQAPVTSKAAPA